MSPLVDASVGADSDEVFAAGADVGALVERERRLYELAMATEDRVEGMRAFLDKRRPEYRGR
jgi:enoyl-CoA hydratase/carnithine racemase